VIHVSIQQFGIVVSTGEGFLYLQNISYLFLPIPVAVLPKAYLCRRLLGSRVRISRRARKFVCCVCCLGSRLCDGLITRSEESYGVCVCVCRS